MSGMSRKSGIVLLAFLAALGLRAVRRDKPKIEIATRSWRVDAAERPRKVYPFSVIPGGAYSGEELERRRRVDRVVDTHYADFGHEGVEVRRLPQDQFFYVSYRKGDRVFWTRDKRKIPRGEAVLTDGKHVARARCGNRLSAVAQGPVFPGLQPPDVVLNAPELPESPGLQQAPLYAALYDGPALPILPTGFPLVVPGHTGASPVAEAFPPLGWQAPLWVVAGPWVPVVVKTGTTTGAGGSGPAGGSGGTGGGGGELGGGGGGGFVTGATIPEPASVGLMVTAAFLLLVIRAMVLISRH